MSYGSALSRRMPGELKPLVRAGSQQRDGAFLHDARAASQPLRSRRAWVSGVPNRRLPSRRLCQLDALVSIGWAGVPPAECSPERRMGWARWSMRPGRALCLRRRDKPLKLVTMDHVAWREEKRRLREMYRPPPGGYGGGSGRAVGTRRRAFLSTAGRRSPIRPARILPDFNYFLDQEKQLRTRQVAAYALTHPRYVAPLLRMGRNSKSGAERWARCSADGSDEGKYADRNG